MKPEEAKPRDLDDLFEEGWKFKVGRIDGAGWFTAKETAEIAKAYAQAIEDNRDEPCDRTEFACDAWRILFKKWSK